jgi:hypothetical protein
VRLDGCTLCDGIGCAYCVCGKVLADGPTGPAVRMEPCIGCGSDVAVGRHEMAVCSGCVARARRVAHFDGVEIALWRPSPCAT